MLKECGNCVKASRTCTYPLTVQKPGPKVGTHRRSRIPPLTVSPSTATDDEPAIKKTRFENGTTVLPSISSVFKDRSDSMVSSHGGAANMSSPSHSSRSGVRSENPFRLLVHPSHDPTDVDSVPEQSPRRQSGGFQQYFRDACQNLGVTDGQGSELINLYFDTMTSFSLFHKPTFEQKLASIDQPRQLEAFLSAIFSYALRFKDSNVLLKTVKILPRSMLDLSLRLQHSCLDECFDDDPPLHLVQSYFLVTWQLLIHGVRGKTWRLLGDCVRLGIELRLNLVDVSVSNSMSEVPHDTDSASWTEAEEKRRIWWGLWEMDIFTSTIRRLPNAIDDRLNYTLLPSTDDDWFTGRESPSCFLVSDAARRWQEVVKSGNQSPQTWFILINSYMYDGFQIAIFPDVWHKRVGFQAQEYMSSQKNYLPHLRLYLEDCLRSAFASLPPGLSCDDKFLAFKSPTPNQYTSSRTLDCFRYCIHVMRQLSRLTIFIGEISKKSLAGKNDEVETTDLPGDMDAGSIHQTWNRYVDAANSTAQVIRNSSPHSYRFVNPLIANSIWYAAASLVVAKLFGPSEFDARLAQSNFELLVTTLNKFEAFWQTPGVLKSKLKHLEETLQHVKRKPPAKSPSTELLPTDMPATPANGYEQPKPRSEQASWTQVDTNTPALTADSSEDILANLEQIDWTTPGLFDFSTMPTFGFGQADLLQTMPFDMNYDPNGQPQNDFLNLTGLFSYPYQ